MEKDHLWDNRLAPIAKTGKQPLLDDDNSFFHGPNAFMIFLDWLSVVLYGNELLPQWLFLAMEGVWLFCNIIYVSSTMSDVLEFLIRIDNDLILDSTVFWLFSLHLSNI